MRKRVVDLKIFTSFFFIISENVHGFTYLFILLLLSFL